ncbi:MAG TPA: class I SAM-dependent methyltransferase [Burkholderiales bacterium]|nr:class I SAM-dependent methyltransferase [Burkholderiales bacterium]
MQGHVDFAYPWYLTYGHLVITAVLAPLLVLAWKKKWPKLLAGAIAVVAAWSVAAFVVAYAAVGVNERLTLPTQAFLASGAGRVLDLGAGSGRSSLMVLEARPKTTLLALDSFGASYAEHFETKGDLVDAGEQRLRSNFAAAGVADRTAIQAADMRKLPFPSASFDGIVSSYAIDHLGRKGAETALGEAYRVLKPGGEFLMMVLAKDYWMQFAWGPLVVHTRLPDQAYWQQVLRTAGFQIVEQGTRPATFYFLVRKPAT